MTSTTHMGWVILNKEAAKALIGWKPVNKRIITVRLQGRHTKATVVQVYAPTEDTEEKDKDDFYEQLQDVFDDIPSHDTKLLIGDFNAKLDQIREGSEGIIGPFGNAQRTNDNGERLRLFCNINGLCICNTFFEHKRIHKLTWRSPDGHTCNEIDYICISQRWKTSVRDVRVYRGADIGSDHHLLGATVKLRLKKLDKQMKTKPFAIEKLKDQTKVSEFQVALTNRFDLLSNFDGTLEEQWTCFAEAVSDSAQDTIGRRGGTKREQWIQEPTWSLIDQRRKKKSERDQARTEDESRAADLAYRDLDKRVKRSCRRDKQDWFNQKGEEAEEAARRNNTKALYRIVRELTGTSSNPNVPIKDKDGNMLVSAEEQDKRWMEHFQETLNQPAPENLFDFSSEQRNMYTTPLVIRQDRIEENETWRAVKN